jgi:hypothetical protein
LWFFVESRVFGSPFVIPLEAEGAFVCALTPRRSRSPVKASPVATIRNPGRILGKV